MPPANCLHTALNLLAGRDHSAVELARKLRGRGFEDDDIKAAVNQLQHSGLQSDSRYAESFLRSRLRRHESLALALHRLTAAGVPGDLAHEIAERLEETASPLASCRALLNKRDAAGSYRFDPKAKAKQVRYLQGKGFDLETIFRAMEQEE